MSQVEPSKTPGAGVNAPQTQVPRIVEIEEIVKKRYDGIVKAVEEYVKAWAIETLRINEKHVSVLARIRLGMIRFVYRRDDEWRERTDIDLMGFSISEVRIKEISDIDVGHVILYIELPNTRTYRIIIDLYNVSDLTKDAYTKYVEEYNKIVKELEAIIEQEKERREAEEVKRKLEEYERLKKENEELKERIRELESELNELREKCSEDEETEEE